MPDPKQALKIAYVNATSENIPPHAVVKFAHDVEDSGAGISVKVVKYSGEGYIALDDGKGAGNGSADKYGQCIKALTGAFWAHYESPGPPEEAWVTEVGPVADQWYMSTSGSGFLYAGLHEPDNQRILVIGKTASPGRPVFVELLTDIAPGPPGATSGTKFQEVEAIVLRGQPYQTRFNPDKMDPSNVDHQRMWVTVHCEATTGMAFGRSNGLAGDIVLAHYVAGETNRLLVSDLPHKTLRGRVTATPAGDDGYHTLEIDMVRVGLTEIADGFAMFDGVPERQAVTLQAYAADNLSGGDLTMLPELDQYATVGWDTSERVWRIFCCT